MLVGGMPYPPSVSGEVPDQLFSSGEKGAWYDPSDLSTLWQDTSRTVPAAVNSPVTMMDDKSGNGLHMIQESASVKPILRVDSNGDHYLEFDGVNDAMTVSNAIANWGTVSEMTIWFAYREITRKSGGAGLFSLSGFRTLAQRFLIILWNPLNQLLYDCGGDAAPYRVGAPMPTTGVNCIQTFKNSVSENVQSVRTNGVLSASDTTGHAVVTGTTSVDIFSIGAYYQNGTAFDRANIRFYGGIFRKAVTSDSQRNAVEAWLASKCGVTLST